MRNGAALLGSGSNITYRDLGSGIYPVIESAETEGSEIAFGVDDVTITSAIAHYGLTSTGVSMAGVPYIEIAQQTNGDFDVRTWATNNAPSEIRTTLMGLVYTVDDENYVATYGGDTGSGGSKEMTRILKKVATVREYDMTNGEVVSARTRQIRLVRIGNDFTSYVRASEIDAWTQLGSYNIGFPINGKFRLAVDYHFGQSSWTFTNFDWFSGNPAG